MSNSQVYVGGVRDVPQRDIRREFQRFGKVLAVDVKKNFAFIVSTNYCSILILFIDLRRKRRVQGGDGRLGRP
jgi:hypothetical protein